MERPSSDEGFDRWSPSETFGPLSSRTPFLLHVVREVLGDVVYNVVYGSFGHPPGLGIIKDLRTALKDNPLPVEVLKELLGRAA